ncbi:MAG: S8 family serine peptidase, partial [Actinomycetota bacterium]|nr:S8 family serine peptidase [Actinomycetota bacterium]
INRLPGGQGHDVEATPSGPAATQPRPAEAAATGKAGMDPLDARLWGLRMVRSDLARERQPGDRRVRIGVLDSGIDATHPDLAPNVDRRLSHNFVVDIPYDENGAVIDGPCEFSGCVDPPNHDDYGHGTHVAGTAAAAADGFGVSGVAPNVTLVDIRIGQDSGYVFLQPALDGIVYGADIGVNVMDLPFAIDPWIYNCVDNPVDTPEQQLQQRTTIIAVNRALDYAHRKGVTLIDETGYTHYDLGRPHPDTLSPDYPSGAAYPRQIDNDTCRAMPIEGNHVIGVSGLGPSGVKADYSNYGVEQVSLAAPGGFRADGFGTPWYMTRDNQILSTYSRAAATGKGWLTEAGEITPLGESSGMLKHCQGTECAFYRWAESTSRAAPHVAGAAALVISQYGDRRASRVTMAPDRVEQVLLSTAQPRPCPTPRLYSYAAIGRPAEYDAYCEGTTEFNGFYGHGIVDAFAAVTRGED